MKLTLAKIKNSMDILEVLTGVIRKDISKQHIVFVITDIAIIKEKKSLKASYVYRDKEASLDDPWEDAEVHYEMEVINKLIEENGTNT